MHRDFLHFTPLSSLRIPPPMNADHGTTIQPTNDLLTWSLRPLDERRPVGEEQPTLAHATGRLPERTKIGWQPFAGPGATPSARPMSSGMLRFVVVGEA